MTTAIQVVLRSGEVDYRSSFATSELWDKLQTYLTCELEPAGVLAALAAADHHGPLTTVYLVDQLAVREEQCEKFGWPNVTIAGERMSQNKAFLTKEEAEAALVPNLKALLDLSTERYLPDAKDTVQKAQDRLQFLLDEDAAARQKLLELTGEPYVAKESSV